MRRAAFSSSPARMASSTAAWSSHAFVARSFFEVHGEDPAHLGAQLAEQRLELRGVAARPGDELVELVDQLGWRSRSWRSAARTPLAVTRLSLAATGAPPERAARRAASDSSGRRICMSSSAWWATQRHPGALEGDGLHVALDLEATQGLPHGDPRHAVVGGDVLLADAVAGPHGAGDDPRPQALGDEVSDRRVGGRHGGIVPKGPFAVGPASARRPDGHGLWPPVPPGGWCRDPRRRTPARAPARRLPPWGPGRRLGRMART